MKQNWIRTLLHELDEAVFPSGIYCISCQSLIDRSRTYSLCDDCIDRFHWITGRTCAKCGKAMPDTSKGRLCYDCMQEDHYFIRGFSCLTYGFYERELMMALKYSGKGYLANIFGDIMFDRIEPEIREGAFCGSDHGRIDIIAPVPVSRGRLRERGYNQSAIMAKRLARRWEEAASEAEISGPREGNRSASSSEGSTAGRLHPAPICRPDLLRRSRETEKLRGLNPTERRMALEGAFVVTEHGRRLLRNKTVLLIEINHSVLIQSNDVRKPLISMGFRNRRASISGLKAS